MTRSLTLLWLTAFTVAGCQRGPAKQPNACEPNPCTELNKNACVDENGDARCLCNPQYVLRPSGVCEQLSLSNCPEHGGDSAEPDDCLARARPMLPSDPPRSQSVSPIGDYDFVKVDAQNRHVYSVTVTGGDPLLPRIDIFDQGGQWLAATDNVGQAQLNYKARYAGLHYIRVAHSPFDPSVATGDYTLSLSTLGAEDHGDGPTEATSISATVANPNTAPPAINGRFETDTDQDWFSFSASSSVTYTVAFDPQRLVPVMSLYDDADPSAPIWTNFQATNPFSVPSSGRYYLVMYPPQGPLSTTAYTFQFTRSQ